jgi:predicted Zn-dependent protease
MPNVWLEAGPREVTLDSLISGVDDGILIEGDGSFPSISNVTTFSSVGTPSGRLSSTSLLAASGI